MSWNTLRTQVKDLLVDDVTKLQEVASYPELDFNGYPAAYIIPSDQEGDYETTSENVRIYAFLVRLFYETKNTGISDAMNYLGDVADDVLDTFDQEDLKGAGSRTVGVNLPTRYTYLNIFATPSRWGEIPGENLMMAEVRMQVRLSIDIT